MLLQATAHLTQAHRHQHTLGPCNPLNYCCCLVPFLLRRYRCQPDSYSRQPAVGICIQLHSQNVSRTDLIASLPSQHTQQPCQQYPNRARLQKRSLSGRAIVLVVLASKAHAAAAQLQLQQSKHTLWTTGSKQQKVMCTSCIVSARRTNLQKGTSKKPNTFRVELPAGVEVDGKAKPDYASPGGECSLLMDAWRDICAPTGCPCRGALKSGSLQTVSQHSA